jgi:hypothetical protein
MGGENDILHMVFMMSSEFEKGQMVRCVGSA